MKTDYRIYRPTGKEWIWLIAQAVLLCGGTAFLFYRSICAVLALIPVGCVYIRSSIRKRGHARREKLVKDFREMLGSLVTALRTGYSVENALRDAELNLLNTVGTDSDMVRELRYINSQVRLSVPVDRILLDLGRRSGSEDIMNFAEVFAVAKRMGGSTAEIVKETAAAITSKIDVEREIETAVAAKKYEQKIMGVMPAFIILYMQLTSPGFLAVMYTSSFGVIVMTVCLAVYAAALWWGAKIVDIRV